MAIEPDPTPAGQGRTPIDFREETIVARDLPKLAAGAQLLRPDGMSGDAPSLEALAILNAYQNESGHWVAVVLEHGKQVEYAYEPEDELSIWYVLYE